jgi:hypothetical protein
LKFLSRDKLPRTLEKNLENTKRLILHFDFVAVLAHFSSARVDLKGFESDHFTGWISVRHGLSAW